jgi:hypothetical protein
LWLLSEEASNKDLDVDQCLSRAIGKPKDDSYGHVTIPEMSGRVDRFFVRSGDHEQVYQDLCNEFSARYRVSRVLTS